MTHLGLMMFEGEWIPLGLWAFLTISAIALFAVFLPITTWIGSRQKEREAYYKSETLRRLSESSGENAKLVLDMLREESRRDRMKAREGLKVGGLINVGVGIGLIVFLRVLLGGGHNSPFLCGLIPGLIGVAMLVYVYLMASPIE